MSGSTDSESGSKAPGFAVGKARASWGRLLLVVLGVLAVGSGGVYWWTFGGGEKWWHALLLPSKAPFRGRVTLDGEPLRGGQLLTFPETRGVPGAIGFIGDDGEFLLRTEIDGNYIEEAFVGRHRVSITQFARQVGASPPRMTSPIKYASPNTSGLIIEVDRDPTKNQAVLNLVSDTKSAAPGPSNGDPIRSSK